MEKVQSNNLTSKGINTNENLKKPRHQRNVFDKDIKHTKLKESDGKCENEHDSAVKTKKKAHSVHKVKFMLDEKAINETGITKTETEKSNTNKRNKVIDERYNLEGNKSLIHRKSFKRHEERKSNEEKLLENKGKSKLPVKVESTRDESFNSKDTDKHNLSPENDSDKKIMKSESNLHPFKTNNVVKDYKKKRHVEKPSVAKLSSQRSKSLISFKQPHLQHLLTDKMECEGEKLKDEDAFAFENEENHKPKLRRSKNMTQLNELNHDTAVYFEDIHTIGEKYMYDEVNSTDSITDFAPNALQHHTISEETENEKLKEPTNKHNDTNIENANEEVNQKQLWRNKSNFLFPSITMLVNGRSLTEDLVNSYVSYNENNNCSQSAMQVIPERDESNKQKIKRKKCQNLRFSVRTDQNETRKFQLDELIDFIYEKSHSNSKNNIHKKETDQNENSAENTNLNFVDNVNEEKIEDNVDNSIFLEQNEENNLNNIKTNISKENVHVKECNIDCDKENLTNVVKNINPKINLHESVMHLPEVPKEENAIDDLDNELNEKQSTVGFLKKYNSPVNIAMSNKVGYSLVEKSVARTKLTNSKQNDPLEFKDYSTKFYSKRSNTYMKRTNPRNARILNQRTKTSKGCSTLEPENANNFNKYLELKEKTVTKFRKINSRTESALQVSASIVKRSDTKPMHDALTKTNRANNNIVQDTFLSDSFVMEMRDKIRNELEKDCTNVVASKTNLSCGNIPTHKNFKCDCGTNTEERNTIVNSDCSGLTEPIKKLLEIMDFVKKLQNKDMDIDNPAQDSPIKAITCNSSNCDSTTYQSSVTLGSDKKVKNFTSETFTMNCKNFKCIKSKIAAAERARSESSSDGGAVNDTYYPKHKRKRAVSFGRASNKKLLSKKSVAKRARSSLGDYSKSLENLSDSTSDILANVCHEDVEAAAERAIEKLSLRNKMRRKLFDRSKARTFNPASNYGSKFWYENSYRMKTSDESVFYLDGVRDKSWDSFVETFPFPTSISRMNNFQFTGNKFTNRIGTPVDDKAFLGNSSNFSIYSQKYFENLSDIYRKRTEENLKAIYINSPSQDDSNSTLGLLSTSNQLISSSTVVQSKNVKNKSEENINENNGSKDLISDGCKMKACYSQPENLNNKSEERVGEIKNDCIKNASKAINEIKKEELHFTNLELGVHENATNETKQNITEARNDNDRIFDESKVKHFEKEINEKEENVKDLNVNSTDVNNVSSSSKLIVNNSEETIHVIAKDDEPMKKANTSAEEFNEENKILDGICRYYENCCKMLKVIAADEKIIKPSGFPKKQKSSTMCLYNIFRKKSKVTVSQKAIECANIDNSSLYTDLQIPIYGEKIKLDLSTITSCEEFLKHIEINISTLVSDEKFNNNLQNGFTQLKQLVSEINLTQAILFCILTYKMNNKITKYFHLLLKKIINIDIGNVIKLNVIVNLLEKVEDHIIDDAVFNNDIETNTNTFVLKFQRLFDLACFEAYGNCASKHNLTECQYDLLKKVVSFLYYAPESHIQVVSKYVGAMGITTESQLTTSITYISYLDTENINENSFKTYCNILCD